MVERFLVSVYAFDELARYARGALRNGGGRRWNYLTYQRIFFPPETKFSARHPGLVFLCVNDRQQLTSQTHSHIDHLGEPNSAVVSARRKVHIHLRAGRVCRKSENRPYGGEG